MYRQEPYSPVSQAIQVNLKIKCSEVVLESLDLLIAYQNYQSRRNELRLGFDVCQLHCLFIKSSGMSSVVLMTSSVA